MAPIDWIILFITLLLIVVYGVWKNRNQHSIREYVKGNNEIPWWTVGLSVMATQASAITFISTSGQAFHDGMGFVQFYFGLPLAMIIICLVFIPLYHKLNILTVYEYLEKRFDKKTRTFAAIIFLIQRGMAAGITIFAPAIILSTILGWDLHLLIVIIGVLVIIYTLTGGTKAVATTQKHQMGIIFVGMIAAFFVVINLLPDNIGFSETMSLAGAYEKLNILDFSFDTSKRYTFWSGITGGLFLALAYFGTDQSQVQRYLAARSMKESQYGLIFNGLLKVPMQFFILLIGVMVFVFYQFEKAPLHFNETLVNEVKMTDAETSFTELENELALLQEKKIASNLAYLDNQLKKSELTKLMAEEKRLRQEAKTVIAIAKPDSEINDKDYVFISFILKYFPKGMIGLLMAVIFSAAMSSTASELNALGSTTAVDLYLSHKKEELSERQMLNAGKGFTLLWGVIAILFASICNLAENLIQFVNIIGSIFYGTVLGLFLIGFFTRNIRGKSVFIAGLISQSLVILIFLANQYELISIGYLWLNAIGCLLVIILALFINKMGSISRSTPLI
jgi:SSS family solute:Na+ symporter